MKKRAALILLILFSLCFILPSCTQEEAASSARLTETAKAVVSPAQNVNTKEPVTEATPAEPMPFTFEEWKGCGLDTDANKEELSALPGAGKWSSNSGADITVSKAELPFGEASVTIGRPSVIADNPESDFWKSVIITVDEENAEAPVLPRDLKIGDSVDEIVSAFGLKEPAYGTCYGDGVNPPYAELRDYYGLPYMVYTFAVAGDREETLCTLEITVGTTGCIMSYSYGVQSRYLPQFGLPDMDGIKEVRIYPADGSGLIKNYTAQEAADILQYIGGARQYCLYLPENPKYIIDVVYEDSTFTLTAGTNGVADMDGRLYSIRFPKSLTDIFMPELVYSNVAAVPDIPIKETTGEGYGSWTDYARVIDTGKRLLPGLPKVEDLTEIRTYRIKDSTGIITFNPAWEGASLLAHIQQGYDKQLDEKLEEPLFNIKVKTKSRSYILVVGKNGIETPDGKVYAVIFSDSMIQMYFPGKIQPDPALKLPKEYEHIYVRNNKTSIVSEVDARDKQIVTDILTNMQLCDETVSGASNYIIGGQNNTYGHSFRYYVNTRNIVFGGDVYKLTEEDANIINGIIKALF